MGIPMGIPTGPGQATGRDFLTEKFLTRTKAEWVDWMADKDIAFAPVNSLREGLDDPQVRHREMVVEDERGWEHLGLAIKYRNEPGRIRFDLPAHSEHTGEVLSGLGYSADEIAAMRAAGAC